MAEEKVIDIEELIQDDHNFNRGTEAGQKLMEESFSEHGAGRSILVDKNGKIIAGNKSQKAAIAAGIKKVRIIETTGDELIAVKRTDVDLDSKEGREMALQDNLTTQVNLAWDETELQTVMDEVEGFDPEQFGFDFEQQFSKAGTQATDEREASEDDFDETKDEVPTICKDGDIWQLGSHRLMCGDSTDPGSVALLMNGEKADMCFTDPPYNVAIGDKNKALNALTGSKSIERNLDGDVFKTDEEAGEKLWLPAFTNLYESAKDNCAIYVTMPQGGTHMMMMMMMMAKSGWQVKHELIWVKNSPTFSMGRLDYDYQHEPICFGWKKNHKKIGKGQFTKSVWTIDKPRKDDQHPTMKPVELIANALLNSSENNDSVLDLFGGSGTTLIAAEQLGRRCFMMELDPHYCDVIIARWEKLTGQKAERLTNVGQPTDTPASE